MTKLVFGVMSAIHCPAVVEQLCQSLAPHQVVIHHDFSQQEKFEVHQPNVQFVPDPKRTGWEDFAFTEGLFKLLTFCLNETDCEYFQLLSPLCLPIRPINQFHQHIDSGAAQVHADLIDLLADEPALVNYGHRSFAANRSWQQRILYRTSQLYFGQSPGLRMHAGLQQRVLRDSGPNNLEPNASGRVAAWLTRQAATGRLGNNPFSNQYRPCIGSTWFGARREVCQYLLDQFSDRALTNYFRTLVFPDEVMISTMIGNAPFKRAAANHLICPFEDARPGQFTIDDLPMLRNCDQFLARKFANDPDDPARDSILDYVRR